jgi:hypothetical protein
MPTGGALIFQLFRMIGDECVLETLLRRNKRMRRAKNIASHLVVLHSAWQSESRLPSFVHVCFMASNS